MATKQSLLLGAAAACLLLLLPSASAVGRPDVEYCTKEKDYPVKVGDVKIVPYPVERGVPTTFSINASSDKTISKGKLVIDVKYWVLPLYSETDDICTKTSCPATGVFELSHRETLPSFALPGSYTIQMKMLGEKDEELSCISFGFSIGFIAPVALS
ncbi:unnamed protein product [Alopecurus aequalis]